MLVVALVVVLVVSLIVFIMNKKEHFDTHTSKVRTECTACRRSAEEVNKWYKVCTVYNDLNELVSQSQVYCGKCKDIGFNIVTCDSDDSQ